MLQLGVGMHKSGSDGFGFALDGLQAGCLPHHRIHHGAGCDTCLAGQVYQAFAGCALYHHRPGGCLLNTVQGVLEVINVVLVLLFSLSCLFVFAGKQGKGCGGTGERQTPRPTEGAQ